MARTHHLLTVLLLSSTPAGACPPTPPDSEAPPKLLSLRGDLMSAGRDKALADTARFAPLCDKDGYPLVGNINAKKVYQPSEFCADLRQRNSQRERKA